MRGSTILILGTVVLSLAAPSHATARPKFGPAAVLGAVTAPLGAVLGGVRPSFVQHGRSPTRPSERSDDDARAQLRPGATVSSERTAAVFWPDAPADLVTYVFFPKGKDERFWAFGYGTIIDAAFADGTDPRGRGRRIVNRESSAAPPAMLADSSGRAELCGNSSAAGNADALTDRIEHAIRPSAVQRDVLKQLNAALAQAIERINSTCSRAIPATPTERLKAIQDRIWAMRDALLTIRLPLEKFYESLTDEQHWRLHRDEPDSIETTGASLADGRAQMCTEPVAAFADGSMRTIERAVRPTERQRASLEALRLRSGGMTHLISSSCPTYPLLGHMGRFAAATDRLDVMLFAVMTMSPALQDFYESLDDKQKTGLDRALRQIRKSTAGAGGS
jgi:hypothetical protein